MADRERLTAKLADYAETLGQLGWRVSERHWTRSRMAFLRGKVKHEHGIDEALVTARIIRDRIRIRRYVLPHDEDEWLTCDEDAFDGFLEEGARGLERGTARQKRTICNCRKQVHRSSGRACFYAKEVARAHGKTGVQRPYDCPDNPRAFHLTIQEKGSRETIPDVYIEPGREYG